MKEQIDHCPHGYSSAQKWCDWRNSSMDRDDVTWIVGSSGAPILVDHEEWSHRRAAEIARDQEIERQRHNHRIMNPI